MSDGRLPVRRHWLRWTIGLVLTALVVAIGWVAVRGIGAVNELQQVAKGASQLKSAIGAGDLDSAASIAGSIEHHARSAHELTSDPIWHGFGVVPWLGPNFTAVGEVAEIADSVASKALSPLVEVSGEIDLASLGFSGGAIGLAPFSKIEPPLASASATLADARRQARHIDADGTLPPLAEAIGELRAAVDEASTAVGALHGAAALLPTMLGGDGPRHYVLAMQNNAELRSSGGIIGAIALLRAENGRVSLVQQASTADFPPLDPPLPTSESTSALFENRPGRFLQNITSIPDFLEAGPIIAARWQGRFGGAVDGVIAIDAVVAEHLMAATGPLTFGPFTADADSVVSILLSAIYAEIPDPLVQDAVFAQASSAMFEAALSGGDPRALLGALSAAADERRIRIWSAHDDEEAILAASTLGGAIPHDDEDGSYVGVLFNDATGGKMDYYTRAEIVTEVGTCDGVPTTRVSVTWRNDAPADAATSLPFSVNVQGAYGVPSGSVRTLIALYGPEGAIPSHTDRDGDEQPVQTAMLGDRTAVQHEVTLAPGESTTVTVEYQGTGAGARQTTLLHTPLVVTPDTPMKKLVCTS